MNESLRILLLFCIAIYYVIIFSLLKRSRLNLKYTLLWLLAGLIMLFFVLFPHVLEHIVQAFGIVELTNGLWAVGFCCVLLLLMAITSIVSGLNDKIRRLVQMCGIYEKRIRELEKIVKEAENKKVQDAENKRTHNKI